MKRMGKKTRVGAASARFAYALADFAPIKPSREELLSSDVLAHLHEKSDPLSEKEKVVAGKALTRMVGLELVREVVEPNLKEGALNLPQTGLVGASISLVELNKLVEAWQEKPVGERPSQAEIALELKRKTKEWLIDKFEPPNIGIFIRDIWIVNGSSSFDLLVMAHFRDSHFFFDYIRNVIQRIGVVESTQTMWISEV